MSDRESWYGCFDDLGGCIYGLCCYPCMLADNSIASQSTCDYKVDNWCCKCFLPFLGGPAGTVVMIDNEKRIHGKMPCSCGGDEPMPNGRCCAMCWCGPCVTCAHARAKRGKGTSAAAEGQGTPLVLKALPAPLTTQPKGFRH
jgi:hypothetical protein